jgi:phosphatidylinositol glycan class B
VIPSQPSHAIHDKYVRIILLSALAIQIISAVNAIGYWHPDQHHSIIEFASYKLGITPAKYMTMMEFPNQIRQTIQVWVFMGFYKVMQFLHLDNAYTANMILRVITSLLGFTLFNYILLRTFEHDRRLTLYILLILANFSWALPYARTQFTSENFGSLAYFSAILLYKGFGGRSVTVWRAVLVGFVLSLAFFFRFQMGFAMIGLGIWFLFVDRASFQIIVGMLAGFLLGTALNITLDSLYYGNFVFTPYNYWETNIIDRRALSSPDSVWNYVGILAAAFAVPPLSVVLLFFMGRGLYKELKDPYSLSVISFLLIHSLVPHKEPRFLFPLIGILPVILGYGLRDYLNGLPREIREADFSFRFRFMVWFSMGLNAALLVLLLFVPVSQYIAFSKKLNDYFDEGTTATVVFYQRTPYETQLLQNVAAYYLHFKKPNLEFTKVLHGPEFLEKMHDHEKEIYFVSTYDRLVRDHLVEEMDCEMLLVSSRLMVWINRWWERKLKGPVIPELWALYECGRDAIPE